MPARKHHYVPVFYQKGFADSEGLVWVYDRDLKTCKHLHPTVVCLGKDLYTVRHDGAPWDRRIETDILSPIESVAASLIRKIHAGERLSLEEVDDLSFFIGLQFTRVPSFAMAVSAAVEMMMNEGLRVQFANVERVQSALHHYQEATGESLNVEAASMVDSIATNRVRIRAAATERPFLESMFDQAKLLAGFVAKSNWTILISPPGAGFISSDVPLVSLPPPNLDLTDTGIGYGIPGGINYFALSNKMCLEMRFGGYCYRYVNVDRRYVRMVNRNIAATSDRFVISSSDRQIKSIVDDCGLAAMEYTKRVAVDVIKANTGEPLVRVQRRHPPMYFYPP